MSNDTTLSRRGFFTRMGILFNGLVAAALAVPVVLFCGVRTGARRYDVHFEPFADRIVLQRSRRAEEMANWVKRYAGRFEAYCRTYPFNWFNFYDFWDHGTHAAPSTRFLTVSNADGIAPVGARSGGTFAPTAGSRDQ